MRIDCPLCGERPLEEFTYRGDASLKRPTGATADSQSAWSDYVYIRENPKGPHKEHWRHAGGCGAWLVVGRNTATHEISDVKLARPGRGGMR